MKHPFLLRNPIQIQSDPGYLCLIMDFRKLTVLFTPLDSWAHINNSHRFGEALRDRGHRVVFAIDIAFKGKLKRYGFEEELHSVVTNEDPSDGINFWADYVRRHKDVFKLTPIEIGGKFVVNSFETMFADLRVRDSQYVKIIERVKPDIIVIDSYIGCPTLTNSGIPYVWLRGAPLTLFNNDNLPPAYSGLPLSGDKNEWKQFRETLYPLFEGLFNKVNNWYISTGAPPLPANMFTALHPRSEKLNIFVYPKELNYKELDPLPHNWVRVDGFMRTTGETFEIPVQLNDRSGKVVYLSMGSFGSANTDLMKRLTAILGKSKHKFIVFKGPLHGKYELPANMWGQVFVPQTAVLPVVDLVVTHGSNNTVTEAFYFGKPMLVLPIFGDQFENAQRIQETGLGLRLNPFHSSEEELISAVDELLNDSKLCERMATIGKRIQNSNEKQMIAEMIENCCLKI